MDNRNRRHWVTINERDYDAADAILEKLYQEGNIDSVRVDRSVGNGELMFGVECGWSDLFLMKSVFTKSGIVFH